MFMETGFNGKPVFLKSESDPTEFTKSPREIAAHFAEVDKISRRQIHEQKQNDVHQADPGTD
jgi:hypothetical protein